MKQRYKELGDPTNIEINKDTCEDSSCDSDFYPVLIESGLKENNFNQKSWLKFP